VSGSIDPLPAGLPDPAFGLFTTRAGGVSVGPWAELNLRLHVGDDEPRRVLANRDLLARHLGTGSVNFAQQTHGAGVARIDEHSVGLEDGAGRRRIIHGGASGVDALVTDRPGVPIGVIVADCLPVLFADPTHRVVGVAHAGRRGLAAGILQNTVTEMLALGATVVDTVAVIGPGICGACYEVPEEMRDEVAAVLPGSAATTRAGTPALDLPAAAERLLAALGLGDVRATGICTAEDERFYSYRRDRETGRFAGVVMLR
jgi:polyphenol oxidase